MTNFCWCFSEDLKFNVCGILKGNFKKKCYEAPTQTPNKTQTH